MSEARYCDFGGEIHDYGMLGLCVRCGKIEKRPPGHTDLMVTPESIAAMEVPDATPTDRVSAEERSWTNEEIGDAFESLRAKHAHAVKQQHGIALSWDEAGAVLEGWDTVIAESTEAMEQVRALQAELTAARGALHFHSEDVARLEMLVQRCRTDRDHISASHLTDLIVRIRRALAAKEGG